jgi:hypothetical protein
MLGTVPARLKLVSSGLVVKSVEGRCCPPLWLVVRAVERELLLSRMVRTLLTVLWVMGARMTLLTRVLRLLPVMGPPSPA